MIHFKVWFNSTIPCHEVGGDDAAPDTRVEHGQELEQLGLGLRLLHQDGDPDQIVVRHSEIDDVLSLSHDGQSSQRNVGVLERFCAVQAKAKNNLCNR